MSKQFETKKESLSIINKAYNDKSHHLSWEAKYKELEEKFKILAKRTKTLENVYQFHKGIIQNISSGIITLDFNENITFINTAALRVVDYDYNEMVGFSIRILFADPEEGNHILNELLINKRMFESKELNLVTRTKRVIPIGFTTTLLKSKEPKYDGVVISFRDLTNLHNFRIQMERMDRLATLGEVSAGIAHEIRNPLAGIKTSAQVLEESFGRGDHRSQLVARIVKEIDRSNDLLKKFFKFAKPGRPQQEFIDIRIIIDGVFLLLSSKMKRKNIEFKSNFVEEIPDVYVDENQIEQVFINLFLNAIDAMEGGGMLNITVKESVNTIHHNTITNKAKMVLVEVKDDGIGIEKENLEKIFNPFFTTKNDGVGLGLSISSRLIEENGGRIEVESEINKGARFSLYLPIK